MEKHSNGYWVNQLSDEQVEDLILRIVHKTNSKTIKFNKIAKLDRANNKIAIVYYSTKLRCYLYHMETTLIIEDFKLNGKFSLSTYYEFMIENFGEEYAKDFEAYANACIAENPEDKWSVKLAKYKDKVADMVANLNHKEL